MNHGLTLQANPLLPTGITGLDRLLGGGYRELSLNLIAGRPGTGKTTLAHQLMFALVHPGHTALYLTALGEPADKILRHQGRYRFFRPEDLQQDIRYLDIGEAAASGDQDELLRRIHAAIDEFHPSFVFIDSFRTLSNALLRSAPDQASMPNLLHALAGLVRSWQATTFLIAEYFDAEHEEAVYTIADGILWLHRAESGHRQLEILKQRGQETIPGRHAFRIGEAGLRVFAPWVDPPACRAPMAGRAGTGIAELDVMLGGGLPRGHALLVAGSSGSGKTTIAESFLLAGTAIGEAGVVANFEQRHPRYRSALLTRLVEGGGVAVVQPEGLDLGVEEITQLLVAEVERLGATRVVIDSLSGMAMLLDNGGRYGFRSALARLLAALSGLGVTVMMTAELEDRHSVLPLGPEGVAFLADGILLQRYAEVGSRLRRLLVVAKLRGSWHSSELREYHIDDAGLHIDDALPGYEGLLGGRPAYSPQTLPVTPP
jgi:circadian clock protein KaiC